jgi:AcrR family transcriptional regulator
MRERFRTATRTALLEASEQVFAERGIDGARIEDIATRAGVAVGTIYNYFADSAEILQVLITDRRKDLIARLDLAIAESKRDRAPWPGQVEAFTRVTLECMRDHHRFYAVLLQWENRRAPSAPGGGVSAEFCSRAAELVRSGVQLGLVRQADASILPALLVTMCRAPLLHLQHAGPAAAWTDDLTEQMLRVICAAICSGQAAKPKVPQVPGRRPRRP